MASRSLGNLTLDLIAKTGGFEQGMDRASRRVRKTTDDMEAARRAADRFIMAIGAAGVAFAGAAAAMAVNAAKSMDATAKMAQQIGTTTEALTGMRFAAQQFASISDQQFDMAMRRMTRRIAEAAEGSGAAKNALDAMGLSAKELARLSPDKQMLAIADAMQKTERQADRLRHTMAIFDTEGMALVPALQQGAAAFEQNIELARRFGVVVSTEAAQAAEEFTTNMGLLTSAQEGFKNQLAEAVLPMLADFSGYLVEIAQRIGPMGDVIEKALKAAGVAAAATAAIFVTRLIGSISASVVAWTAATASAARYQMTLASMAATASGAGVAITAMSGAAAAGMTVMGRAAQLALGVMGGPLGLLVTTGLAAAAFITLGRDAKTAAVDVDELTESLGTLNQRQMESAAFHLENELAALQAQAEGSTQILRTLASDHAALTQRYGENYEGLRNVQQALREEQQALDDTNAEIAKKSSLLSEINQRLAEFGQATSDAASEQRGLNDAMAGFSGATGDYLKRMQERTAAMLDGNSAVKQAERYLSGLTGVSDEYRAAVMSQAHAQDAIRKANERAATSARASSSAVRASTKVVSEAERAAEAFRNEQERGLLAQYDAISALHQQAVAIEDQIATLGMNKSAIEALIISRRQEQIAILQGFSGSEKQIELIEREIEARKRIMGASDQLEAREANRRAAEEALAEWERTAEDIERALTDALMRGFEDGKGFAENFRDTLKNMFNTLILRPMIQPIAEQAASTITGFMGVGGRSRGGVGGFGGLGGMSGVGAAPGTLGMANAWGSMGGDSMGALIAGNSGRWGVTSNMASTVSTGLGYAAALYALTEKQYGTAVGTAIGTAIMPGVGTVVGSVLGGLVDGMFNEPEARFGGTYQYRAGMGTERPGWERGDPGPVAMQFADNLLRSASDAVQRAFAAAGSDALLTALEASFESSEKGRGGTHSGGWLLVDGELIRFGTERKGEGFGGRDGTLEEMMQAAEIDTYQTVIQAWQSAIGEFPRIAQEMLRSVNADALDLAQAQQFIQTFLATLEQINELATALSMLPFTPVIAGTREYAAALAEATGSAESAANLISSFYQNFYSEAERAAALTEHLTAELAKLGFEFPRTREEFRALIEANMALGEAGANTVAALLGMESALSSLLPTFEAITDAVVGVDAAFQSQLQVVRDVASELGRLAGLRNRAGTLLDRINRNTTFGDMREQELWAALAAASYEQQIELASELTDIVLSRYETEIQAAQRMQDIGRGLRDYLASLSTSELAPTDLATKVAEAERQLQEAVAKARAGDEDAMGQIQGLTQNALELWRRYGASGDAYQDAYYRITGMVGDLAAQAMSDADRQLSVSRDTLAQLEQLRGVAETAYNAIDAQYQAMQLSLQNETHVLTELGIQSGQLNTIADLLRSMPAGLASALQPMLDAATQSVISGWYDGTGITPDSTAMDYWTGQLGSRPQSVVQDDFYKTLVDNWYKDNLGWSGDIQGINYWANQVEQIGAQKAFEDFAHAAGIPGYWMGGYASGLSLVGERGPELVDFTNPGRVYSNDVLANVMRRVTDPDVNSSALVAEVKALREEVKALREQNNAGNQAIVQTTAKTGDRIADATERGVHAAALAR